MSKAIAIIGGGKLGIAMGKQLTAAGFRLTGVCCRSKQSALRAADMIGTKTAVTDPLEITTGAQLVLITTPDDAIAQTYRTIAEHNGFSNGATALHCSGSLPSTILTAPGDSGVAKGSLHPLQSFAVADTTGRNPFHGIIAAIEGDEQALADAAQLGQALGATVFTIKTSSKALYHAAAVVASNYLVALVDTAFSFLASAGIKRQDAFTILSPLIQGTLSNIKAVGIPQALTGPIVRGDIKTIVDHLHHIHDHNEDLLMVYSSLGMHTIRLAVDRGAITSSQADAIRNLLKGEESRPPDNTSPWVCDKKMGMKYVNS